MKIYDERKNEISHIAFNPNALNWKKVFDSDSLNGYLALSYDDDALNKELAIKLKGLEEYPPYFSISMFEEPPCVFLNVDTKSSEESSYSVLNVEFEPEEKVAFLWNVIRSLCHSENERIWESTRRTSLVGDDNRPWNKSMYEKYRR